MRRPWLGMILLGAVATWGAAGCRSCPRVLPASDTCASCPPKPLLGELPPHRLTPLYASPTPPPAAVAAVPPVVPQAPIPAPGAPDVRTYGVPAAPPANPTWQPSTDGRVQVIVPQAATEPPREPARLYAPEPVPAAPAPPKPGVAEERSQLPARPPVPGERPRPPVAEERREPPSLPVGIPRFAGVRDGVTSGLKPSLDGGLDWLQAHGYRTVLHLRPPGEDDAADRREVEKRGMKYVSLEVSPQNLSAALVESFNHLVSDTAVYPLFVYDRDGTVAGGLFYLYFRMVDRASDEAARAKAAQLGLPEDGNDAHKAMWLAVQKFLSTSSK